MQREQFENLVNEAVALLPANIREKLDNVAIVVEEGESPNNSLFGLYHGVSQLLRGPGYGIGGTLPDKITIWQGTIEKFAQDESQIPGLIRRVVWHEIGHHFGFDEAGIRRLEQKWAQQGKV
ncbi:MAG TPA: metallopeptidase family protein [Patescibacteria group bacterium]|nr:metallopeptidase family protein [Patescibacteria group bacterium]